MTLTVTIRIRRPAAGTRAAATRPPGGPPGPAAARAGLPGATRPRGIGAALPLLEPLALLAADAAGLGMVEQLVFAALLRTARRALTAPQPA